MRATASAALRSWSVCSHAARGRCGARLARRVVAGGAPQIQGRDVNVLDAVYHVVEHFSMHTGQIILLTKRYAPGRVQFYEDAGGLARPRF